MAFRTLDDLDVKGKRVLVRADLNVPVADGKVTDATRIERQAPTIRELADKGAQGHRAQPFRPAQGQGRAVHVAEAAGRRRWRRPSGRKVAFADDCIGPKAEAAVAALKDGDVLLLENTRFHKGEEENDPGHGQSSWPRWATSSSMTPSRAAHRAHASHRRRGAPAAQCGGPLHAGRTAPIWKRRWAIPSGR